MDAFRLEKWESFAVKGFRLSTTNHKKQAMKEIPEFWANKGAGVSSVLLPMMNKEPYGVLGINAYNTNEKDTKMFDYYIAVSSDVEDERLVAYHVKEALWEVFPCTYETIGKTEVMAITKHLPKAGYAACNKGYITGKMKSVAPDIEYYGQDNQVEVWIEVQKK